MKLDIKVAFGLIKSQILFAEMRFNVVLQVSILLEALATKRAHETKLVHDRCYVVCGWSSLFDHSISMLP